MRPSRGSGCPVTLLLAREPQEDKRVEYLLSSMKALPNAVFIRNGSEYKAETAEKHLRQKLDYAGERLKTAEQFIDYCATKSSMSGRVYQIRFSDGKTVEAAVFLHSKLVEFDQRQR